MSHMYKYMSSVHCTVYTRAAVVKRSRELRSAVIETGVQLKWSPGKQCDNERIHPHTTPYLTSRLRLAPHRLAPPRLTPPSLAPPRLAPPCLAHSTIITIVLHHRKLSDQ